MTHTAKHTPGPYKVVHDNSIDATYIVPTEPPDSHAIARIYRNHPEYEENAHLIAAAPAMYLELKEGLVLLEASHHDMVDMYGTDSLQAKTVWERIESTRNTLAQAEGSSHV